MIDLDHRLQDQLDDITANTRNLVQPERLAIGEQAVADLFASGVEERILPVGARAPEFALPDASGRLVRSSDLLALGPRAGPAMGWPPPGAQLLLRGRPNCAGWRGWTWRWPAPI